MFDLAHDVRIDQTETLFFKIATDDPKAYTVQVDAPIEWRGRAFYMAEVDQARDGSQATFSVLCKATWYRLGERRLIGSRSYEAYTVRQLLEAVLDGTGWTVSAGTTNDATLYTVEGQDQSVLWWVRTIAQQAGLYIAWDTLGQQVTVNSTRGRTLGVGFRYRKNLTQIERKATPPRATRLYAYGRDALDLTVTNGGVAYLADYSYYTSTVGLTSAQASALYTKDEVWTDTNIVDETALLNAAQARLAIASQPVYEYRMAVADLSDLTGIPEDDVQVGDTVRVADEVLGIDVATIVTRIVRYPLEPWRNQVELASSYDPTDVGASIARSPSAQQWLMFKDDNPATIQLRSTSTWFTNRISLAFAGAGEAVFGYDLHVVGVGTGTLSVSAIESVSGVLVHDVETYAFTDGQVIHDAWTWATKDLNGQKDYRIRMSVSTASGGASATGVNLETGDSRFWIMAKGAVQRSPAVTTSQRFDYTGAVQTFTVPDNITEITVTAVGAQGKCENLYPQSSTRSGGAGGSVTATFPVTPGAVYDVYVGGGYFTAIGTDGSATPGWPDGGTGDTVSGGNGQGGGGSTSMRPTGGAFTASIIVAGGGGGAGEAFSSNDVRGGDAGFVLAGNGYSPNSLQGSGASQFGGGAGGSPDGQSGSQGQGGAAGDTTNAFTFPGGGGGGGWYGGGGAGSSLTSGYYVGGGGGGSGYVAPTGFDISASDGSNRGTYPDTNGHGWLIVEWDATD